MNHMFRVASSPRWALLSCDCKREWTVSSTDVRNAKLDSQSRTIPAEECYILRLRRYLSLSEKNVESYECQNDGCRY